MEAGFDYVVVTASTPKQREYYRALVQRRIDAGLYPKELQFRFYNDPQTGRVGSGGGTLVALAELFREETGTGSDMDVNDITAFFRSKRVLILHAGGESRRLPCYVPEGKLFAPLAFPQAICGSPCPPVVLDIVLWLYFKYPWEEGEVILASGDVIVDFNTEAFTIAHAAGRFLRGDICGFGKSTTFEQGSRHGVFAFDNSALQDGVPTLPVKDFHQKSSPEVLERECPVVGDPSKCAVDMGIFSLGHRWVHAFFEFALSTRPAAGEASGDGVGNFLAAVEASGIFFDFYLECVTASLPGQSSEVYINRMQSSGTKMTSSELQVMHRCFSSLGLRGALVTDAVFLHFGTITEFPDSSTMAIENNMWPIYIGQDSATLKARDEAAIMANSCPHDDQRIFVLNCSQQGRGVVVQREGRGGVNPVGSMGWVENCSASVISLGECGFNMIVGVHGLDIGAGCLPDGICLDGRHWSAEDARPQSCVAVYGSNDSFKGQKTPDAVVFCGVGMSEWLKQRGLSASDIWEAGDGMGLDLWTAKLFCMCGDLEMALYSSKLAGYWNADAFDKAWFKATPRVSLRHLNDVDSALERDARRMEFRSGS